MRAAKLTFLLCIFTLPLLAQLDKKIARLDSALTYLHERQLFNGTLLLAENGKAVYRKALGIANIATGEALQTTSAFNLASVSKQFVCMTVMMLKERGKLSYDDEVRKHLPEFPYEKITLRHLMNHTSGLPEYFDLALRFTGSLDTLDNGDILEMLAAQKPPLVFQPGEKWEYCNTGYVLLVSVVERISGQAFVEFFQKNISHPLGLRDTYVYHLKMAASPTNRVFGFRREDGKRKPDDLMRFDGVVGDGNVYSSAEDLLKWEQALFTEKLVKQTTLQEAFMPGKLNDGSATQYGFGWGIAEGGKVLAHTGGWVGFRTLIVRHLEQKLTLVVLNNDGNAYSMQVAQAILNDKPFTLPQTHLFKNIRLVDGTGTPARPCNVRLRDERIWEIGDLEAYPNELVTDGKGMVLAPGFIDSHSHHDWTAWEQPGVVAATNQGITTIVAGNDGGSSWMDTIEASFQKQPIAVNLATYTGHATLRAKAMGGYGALRRQATPAEVEKMKALLEEEMKKGSFGLATGLEYESGFYANRDEVLALAKVAAAHKGRYISHIRSEDTDLDNALDEIIQIGREANIPVQISHIKVSIKSKWGYSRQVLAALQQARASGVDITADCYPYTFWQSTLRVLFPKHDFTNPASAEFAVTDLVDPAGSYLTRFAAQPEYAKKTISEVAKMRGESPATTLLWLVATAEEFEKSHPDVNAEGVMGAAMSDEDVSNFLAWSHTNVCSDGSAEGHPRGHGAFTRVLRKYVREEKLLTLEAAIHKMTGLTAEHLGITDRGIVAPGYFADLVLFDPVTVRDNADVANNKALSTGVAGVWVNGKLVYENQRETGARAGRFLKNR